jgi:serine/threonine-protein kinase
VRAGLQDRRRVLLMAAVALMVLVVIGSTWWVTLGRYTDSPPMVNMTKEQAELYADQNNFELTYGDGIYSETAAKDTVISQDPPAGERLVKGGVITLSLSLGKERFPVPELSGLELTAAKGELDQRGLKLKEGKGQYSDTVPEGAVLTVSPKAGTELKRGETVTVVVSLGRAPIRMPDLSGKNVNDARAELAQLGLGAVERYKDSDQPKDAVIGQNPKPSTGVAKDTEVTLDVSKGPPLITVPDLTNQPCQQAQATLLGMNLRVRIDFNANAFVRSQNPPPNTQVPPQTEVAIQCF